MNGKAMMCAVVAAAMAGAAVVFPAIAAEPTISVTAKQRYPWNGKFDITYTASGVDDACQAQSMTASLKVFAVEQTTHVTNVAKTASLSGDLAVSDGTHKLVWDMDTQGVFKELVSTNFEIFVSIAASCGVQLWENGPYWAECNVGATNPEEYGYYFWWGDTVGYKRNANNDGWVSVKEGTAYFFNEVNCPTCGKNISTLQSLGYIDSSGNLTATHDAATAHLGSSWRMPTDVEVLALDANCTTTWIITNGVTGRLVAGKGDYASKSIFLPAAGYGLQSYFNYASEYGFYRSSAYSDYINFARTFFFGPSGIDLTLYGRDLGQTVRPLRGFSAFDANTEMVCIGGSGRVRADLRTGEVRATEATEILRYSTRWDGGGNETATVTLAQDGAILAENLTGDGEQAWSVTQSGTYNLTHTTYSNGMIVSTLNASFIVTGKTSVNVTDATAAQRYPWNGMVDIAFTITGDAGTAYETKFTAKDVAGGTNLVMKTVEWVSGGAARPESAPYQLTPGNYRFVWNAGTDLPDGFESGRVTITVEANENTDSSPEFKLDLRGLGPWQRHTAAATETLTYSSAWATNAASGAKAVVKVMPVLKAKPKYLVIDLSGGTNATSYGISYLDEVPGGSWSDEYKTSKLVLRHIPAGSFIMGGRATDYPGAVNTNLHLVTITRDFYMGVFEVTQRQWELVMGTRPSGITNELYYAKRPVEKVSYNDMRGAVLGSEWPKSYAVDDNSFMGVLRKKANLSGLDLPTAAQWEYACRAGTTTGLNSGKNLTALIAPCENLNQVARNAYNSGRLSVTSTGLAEKKYAAADLTYATAWVGMYAANNYGLYDMHGNVYERVLDRALSSIANSGAVDPVGSKTEERRLNRGGGWCSTNNWSLTYSFPTSYNLPTDKICSDGFRLCLQGGDIPDFASATTLVNESGAGSQSWTPTRSGSYYLTHATMNGTTNMQLASAWFEVPGCTLTLEPQGELTNGVNVAIGGAGEGWTVYYTTNGIAPTTNSTVYAGAFSLPESGTVRAVAYNEQGVASEEATTTFTLHDTLSVVGAVARQRYPWNGRVDVDVELKGDPEVKYKVEVEAKDLDGGTNLPVRTVKVGGGRGATALPSTSTFNLQPGSYRLTWNADADIAADGEFPRVAVTVKASEWSVENLHVTGVANATGGVSIAWNVLEGASRYRIYKGEASTALLPMATVTDAFFAECNQTGTAYYAVSGIDANGVESGLCAPVSVVGFTTVVTDGLVAYYPFNEDGRNDYSGGDRYLDKYNSVSSVKDHLGVPNHAALFTGVSNEYAVCSRGWHYTNNVSVAFWFKAETNLVITKVRTFMIFPVYGGNDDVVGLGVVGGTNGLAVCEHKGNYLESVGTYNIDFGKIWHHCAVTVDNNGAPGIYVDGDRVMTGTCTGYKIRISNGCSIGGGPYGYGCFKGCLDDVRFYNRALSADEVKTIYNWVDDNRSVK